MPGEPGETRSQQERADGTPYRATCTQSFGDGAVATGNLALFADPLHGSLALILVEAERRQVQLLPGRDGEVTVPEDPSGQEPGT